MQEINRSNRRIMKQTFVSDVLEIPDKIDTATPKVNTAAHVAAATIPTTHPADSTTEDDDEENEDDWENIFDESGDCLDPKILQELTDSVGKCKIELPKMDYTVSNDCINVLCQNANLNDCPDRSTTLSNHYSTKRNSLMSWRFQIFRWNSRPQIYLCFSHSTKAPASTSNGWTTPMP